MANYYNSATKYLRHKKRCHWLNVDLTSCESHTHKRCEGERVRVRVRVRVRMRG